MDVEAIKIFCKANQLRWTNHVLLRLLQRNISTDDVVYALMNGEIIEQYPEDCPYPSCLVLGITIESNCIHVVCGASDIELWLITAYYPNPDEWTDDFKTRKGKVK